MKKIAALTLSVVLLGLWGCASKPDLSIKQKKQIEYLEAIADQKDREADRTESLAKMYIDRAGQLRKEAQGYREKAALVTKGQDLDELEHALRKERH
ncbi:MAG: hypothetical protein GXP25_13935 [Planctomycetes bacterium]|nr:hypothetical protein [Planctomycetota bacterium]